MRVPNLLVGTVLGALVGYVLIFHGGAVLGSVVGLLLGILVERGWLRVF